MTRLDGLRSLLLEVHGRNPFYTAKLAGVDLDLSSLADFSTRVPFTFKQELSANQIANPPYGTNLTYPLERYTRFCQTSGTTGQPMRWLDTPESWSWMLDCWDRVFEAAGVDEFDRIFFAFSFGPFLGFWLAFEAAERRGCLVIPGGGMSSELRVRAILDNEATVLCCTPSYAIRLAEIAASAAIDLTASRVRRIIVGGEAGGSIPATRARMESLWPGATVVDHHGMTEIGPVTYGCPKVPGVLHIIEPDFYPEILETGELVLTNLGRVGSPLIRYRTGDIVKPVAQERCVCGAADMALEGGILSRVDDMIVVRGINVYPSAVEDILRSCGVTEFRAAVSHERAMPELRIEVEGTDDGVAVRAQGALRNAFMLRVSVARVADGSLPRFEGKARRWVR